MARGTLLIAAVLVAAGLAPTAAANHGPNTLLDVDDGAYFYDSDGDCEGDTNDNTQGEALRHWHVGLPFVPAEAEVASGYGCGPAEDWSPQTWQVTVAEGHIAEIDATVTYTWDQDVPGGGFNDVHLHVYDDAGNLVTSTLQEDGPQPVNPTAPMPPPTHELEATLAPGTYEIEEDIFSGEHTTWLTEVEVVEKEVATASGG